MNDAAHVWKLSGDIVAVIETWLREKEGKLLYAHFKRVDLLRLTRLQVWSWRHRVDIDEILSLTLPYLRKSLSSGQKTKYGLGCSVAALTGVGNEKILIEALNQKYPGGENRDIWRQEERQRQLDRESAEASGGLSTRSRRSPTGILESDSVASYLQSYRARVLGVRHRLSAQSGSVKRKRKHYRGNPWL
jgi:hypothetical protein